jgi:hypothetical protein
VLPTETEQLACERWINFYRGQRCCRVPTPESFGEIRRYCHQNPLALAMGSGSDLSLYLRHLSKVFPELSFEEEHYGCLKIKISMPILKTFLYSSYM